MAAIPTTLPPRTRSTTLRVATIEHPPVLEQVSGTSATPFLTRVLPTLATPACGVDLVGVPPSGASGAGGDGTAGVPAGAGGVGHRPPPAP